MGDAYKVSNLMVCRPAGADSLLYSWLVWKGTSLLAVKQLVMPESVLQAGISLSLILKQISYSQFSLMPSPLYAKSEKGSDQMGLVPVSPRNALHHVTIQIMVCVH